MSQIGSVAKYIFPPLWIRGDGFAFGIQGGDGFGDGDGLINGDGFGDGFGFGDDRSTGDGHGGGIDYGAESGSACLLVEWYWSCA